MEEEDWEKIRQKYVDIVADLNAEEVALYLYQDEIFHMGDTERIKHEVTSAGKATKLLSILKCKHGGYRSFYTALTKVHSHLADMLRPPSAITPANNPVTYIRSLYEEASEAQVPLSEIQEELQGYTGKTSNATDTRNWIEQAFELAEFSGGGKKKKKYPSGLHD